MKFITEFKIQIDLLVKELKSASPKKESLEWYLINNLEKYLVSLNESETKGDILRATKIFSRFCIDSMDWDTEIFRKYSVLTDGVSKLAKREL